MRDLMDDNEWDRIMRLPADQREALWNADCSQAEAALRDKIVPFIKAGIAHHISSQCSLDPESLRCCPGDLLAVIGRAASVMMNRIIMEVLLKEIA